MLEEYQLGIIRIVQTNLLFDGKTPVADAGLSANAGQTKDRKQFGAIIQLTLDRKSVV